MAQKRMFNLTVTDTDDFLDMPLSAQALYFHLGMHGDDDGFVGSPRKIMRSVGATADDLNELTTKGFIIPFNSGVIVIRDWNINNTLKNDRYHQTVYQDEKNQLISDNSGRYRLRSAAVEPTRNQDGTSPEPEQSIAERNEPERRPTEQRERVTDETRTPPTVEDVQEFCINQCISDFPAQRFIDYYQARNWKINGECISDWNALVRVWADRDREKERQGKSSFNNIFLQIYEDEHRQGEPDQP